MSQPSRRDWVIARGPFSSLPRFASDPASHPVPSNSWRQLPAFISAPSSDQKPTFGSYHLDSFFFLQLRSRLSRPCHAILSRITKILVPDLASQVRSPRPVSLCEGLQAFSGIISRVDACHTPSHNSEEFGPSSHLPEAAAPYRLCTKASLPSEDSCSPLPPERILKQQLIACTCRGAAFGRTTPD